ncbi:MAG: mechanosensitive ion channel domain-containing protein [Verrucomicrobiota bacterium]|nr:mechanosensitive ion channel domain-containing protein [Verrucomicrobiota bacterium]
MVQILEHLDSLEPIGYFTFAVNLIVLLFSGFFARRYGQIKDPERTQARLRILHGFNFIVFATFLLAVIFKASIPRITEFSESCLVILCTYLLIHLIEAALLRHFGHERTIEGFTRWVETYTSKTLELVSYAILILVAAVLLANIWGFDDALKTTGVIGFLALCVFTTKDYWLGDFLSGLIIITKGNIERGNVIQIPKENILGIVLQTRATQTIIRDLARGHDITVPNTLLLNQRVDIFRTDLKKGVLDYVEFDIGYGTSPKIVRAFLQSTWKNAFAETSAIDPDQPSKVDLKYNRDHAATWRLTYTLKNPHRLLEARNAVNLAAYELQEEHDIELRTPFTAQVENLSAPHPEDSATSRAK